MKSHLTQDKRDKKNVSIYTWQYISAPTVLLLMDDNHIQRQKECKSLQLHVQSENNTCCIVFIGCLHITHVYFDPSWHGCVRICQQRPIAALSASTRRTFVSGSTWKNGKKKKKKKKKNTTRCQSTETPCGVLLMVQVVEMSWPRNSKLTFGTWPLSPFSSGPCPVRSTGGGAWKMSMEHWSWNSTTSLETLLSHQKKSAKK